MKIKASTQAKASNPPGRHSAGGHSLYLNVTEGDGKSWVQRLTINGRKNTSFQKSAACAWTPFHKRTC